ncbi:uncharacterized protein LOC144512453 [Sander vitreus]
MESLLDNPMKAVLYLKELTTIERTDSCGIPITTSSCPLNITTTTTRLTAARVPRRRPTSISTRGATKLRLTSASRRSCSSSSSSRRRRSSSSSSSSSRFPVYRPSLSSIRTLLRRRPTTHSSCSSYPPRRSHPKRAKPAQSPPRRTRGVPAASPWFRRLPPLSAALLDWLGKRTTKQCFTSSAALPQRPLRWRPLLPVSPAMTFLQTRLLGRKGREERGSCRVRSSHNHSPSNSSKRLSHRLNHHSHSPSVSPNHRLNPSPKPNLSQNPNPNHSLHWSRSPSPRLSLSPKSRLRVKKWHRTPLKPLHLAERSR